MAYSLAKKLGAVLIAALIWLAGCSTADDPNKFITSAGNSGLAETQLSLIALQRSQTPEIKTYAQQMITDHTRTNTELAQLAGKKGVSLPREMDSAHKALARELEKLSGETFDKRYVDVMLEDHEKTITEFDTQIRVGSDSDVKAFARKQLPVLQEHLQMARDLRSKYPQ